MSESVVFIVGIVFFLVISLSIHEYAHALVAHWCGDDTAKNLGRLTINPIKHIDPMFSIVVPVMLLWATGGSFVFGGAKPVPVNPNRLRNPGRDMALVAIAGPLSNVILAVIFLFAYAVSIHFGYFEIGKPGARWLWGAASLNLVLAVFNMIPIPPLDGSRVMGYLLPRQLSESYLKLEQYGILIVFGIMVLERMGYIHVFGPILENTVTPMFNGILAFWRYSLGI